MRHIIFILEGVAYFLYKSWICDFVHKHLPHRAIGSRIWHGHVRQEWCRWEGNTQAECRYIFSLEIVEFILYKDWNCDSEQKYISQMMRAFSKLASPHEAKVVSLGRHTISGSPLIFILEIIAFFLYKSWICDFGQKYMSHMVIVFSVLASPHQARVISLKKQNISGFPFII